MRLLYTLCARCRALAHHPAALRVAHHAEAVGNVALVSATGFHEWGNIVGFACVPVLAFLLVSIGLSLVNVASSD